MLQQTYQQSMSLDPDDFQQAYQRQDLHALASQAEKNNFNIRKFKDKSSIKDKRKSLYTKYTQASTKNRVSTEPVEDRFPMKSSMSYTNAFQRIMSKNEPDHQKRNTFVGSLKSRNQNYSIDSYQSKAKQSRNEETDIQTQKAEKYKEMAKKHHKGPLNRKIVETWLNSILMETIQFEVLDESLGNAALKKFQIDENSLISRSIKPENVNKIYQSLFVHSIGFNNNIKELVSGNSQVLKNIWKVFSILLQYCAQGKFQTLIGIIQRQKALKIEQLRQQVSKRQQIIERNDELNQTKNIQIFKEIKNLKQLNINLTNEKDILFEDYQKTQQAFNEEVALRLKFQNKINELFGVHRELAVKHQRLYDDYKKKVLEWNSANQKNSQLSLQNGELKIQINDLVAQKQRFLSSEKYNKQLILSLKQQKLKLKDEYNIVKHNYDQQRRMTKQYKRRLTQLQIQVKNLSELVSIKDKSWKQTHSEYQISLEENNRLYAIISEQRIQVEGLLFEKKQFNNTILNLMAEASYEKKKKEEFTKLYYETDRKLNQKLGRVQELELEVKIAVKKNQSAEKDLQSNYANIKSMHEKNNQLEDQLHYLRRFRDNLDSVIQQKQNIAQKFRVQNQTLQSQNQQLKVTLNKSQMQLKLTKAQLSNQIDNLNHKLQKFREQTEQLLSGDDQKNKIIMSNKLQIQRITKLLQNTVLDLKNQKFQRFNLKANYQQSLTIIQKKNTQEKEMGREISELKETAAKNGRDRDRMTFAYQSQVLKRQKCEQNISDLQKQFSQFRQQKAPYIHAFIFQDVAETYRRTKQKLQIANTTIKMKIQQLNQTHQKYKAEISSLIKSNKDYFETYKTQKQKELFQKQSQLQYEKQIKKSMKERLEKLETLAETYAKKIQERTTSQKQKIYADLIEQKSKSIEELMEKLGIQSRKCQALTGEISRKSQEHQKQVIQINRKNKIENQAREEKISQLNFQLQYIQKQSEKLVQEIKQHETMFEAKLKQRMEVYLENYKKTPINEGSNAEYTDRLQKDAIEQKKNFNQTHANWSLLQKIQKNNPQIKKRNQMSKKIKIAYSYYKQ